MRRIKSAILGLALLISAILSGACNATQLPPIGDPAAVSSPVVAAVVRPYGGEHARCSAVIIEPNLAVTAGHCVRAIGAGIVIAPNGEPSVVTTAWVSDSDDIALIHLDEPMPLVAPVSTTFPRIGSGAFVAGYGCDSTWRTLRLGVRNAQFVGRDSVGAMWFGGLVCHGDSGGGTFDSDGALLGVNSLVDTDDGPVHAFAAEPIAGALDGLMSDADWLPADEFLDD